MTAARVKRLRKKRHHAHQSSECAGCWRSPERVQGTLTGTPTSVFQCCTSCISKEEGFCPLLLLHRGCCRGCRQRADPRELLWCRDLPPAAWQGRCQEASSPRKAGGHNPESFEQQGTRARRTDSVSNTTMPAMQALTEQQLCSLPHCSSARCIHQVSSLWAEPTGNKLPAEARPGEGERAGPLEGGYLVASLQA